MIKDTQPKEKEKTKEKKRKAKSSKVAKKRLNKELEVVVMNNTNGRIFYRCPKTMSIIEMQEYGDMDTMTLEQLNTMRNSHKAMLENFWIVIVDVYDDEITVDDVIEHLRLKRLYGDMEFYDEAIDKLILDTSLEEFKEKIKVIQPKLVLLIAQRIKVLDMRGQFGDSYKMRFLEDYIGKEGLFD